MTPSRHPLFVALLTLLLLVPSAASQVVSPVAPEHELDIKVSTSEQAAEPGGYAFFENEVTLSCSMLARVTFPYDVEHRVVVHADGYDAEDPFTTTIYELPPPCTHNSAQITYAWPVVIGIARGSVAYERVVVTLSVEGPDGASQATDVFVRTLPQGEVTARLGSAPITSAEGVGQVAIIATNAANTPVRLRTSYHDVDDRQGTLFLASPVTLQPRAADGTPTQTVVRMDYLAPKITGEDRFVLDLDAFGVFDTSLRFKIDPIPVTATIGPADPDDPGTIGEAPAHPILLGPLVLAAIAAMLRRRPGA